MKNNCSFKEHKETEAISYCFKCQIYLCNKCIIQHKGWFNNHHIENIDKIKNEIFTGFCQEKNHDNELNYFCKSHNELCCALCICKIKGKGNGEHKDCDICFIEDIKEEKKSKLKNNIKSLEELSNNIEANIKDLKTIFEEVNKNKEKLKLNIQKIFTKIRNELNNREDILLLEIDKYFDDNYCNEEIIKLSEKLPKRIKDSLDKGKSIENKWNDENELKDIIYDCLNIENNIKDINSINKSIKQSKEKDKINIQLFPNEKSIDIIINEIKNFGCLFESFILKNEVDFIKFSELCDIKMNNIKLLYRSTRDGFDYLNIVNKINNKSNLIFLYKTENDKIFGAYIKTKLENINLNGSRKYYKDENAFSFSLNNNKKYKILQPSNAIGFDSTYYIFIGNNNYGNGFYYYKNIIYDQDLINCSKIYDFSKNSELTEGHGKLVELEIFEINNS